MKKAECRVAAATASSDVATMFLPELATLGPAVPPSAKARQTRDVLSRQQKFLKQVQHQTTHSLARFFLEIDANYKQFQTATRYCGPPPISDWKPNAPSTRKAGSRSTATSTPSASTPRGGPRSPVQDELQHRARRARRGEGNAPGIRQDHRRRAVKAPAAPKGHTLDDQTRTASFEEPAKASDSPVKEKATCDCDTAGKTVSFQMTVGVGSKPVEIRGTFTVARASP